MENSSNSARPFPAPSPVHVRIDQEHPHPTPTPGLTPGLTPEFAPDSLPDPAPDSTAIALTMLHRLYTNPPSDRDALLRNVIEIGCQLLHTDEAVVLKIQDDRVIPLASRSQSADTHDNVLARDQSVLAPLPIAQTPFADTIKHNKTYRYRPTRQTPPPQTPPSSITSRFDRWVESIITPIRIKQKIYGVLAWGATTETSHPLTTADHTVVEMLGQALSHHFEIAQLESERRFRTLVDHAADYAMLSLDTDGQIMTYSRGVTSVLGYNEQELLKKDIHCLFPPKANDGTDESPIDFDKAKKTGRLITEGWRMCRNGKRIWAISMITPIYDQAGKLAGYAKVLRDRTDRKRAEEQLRRSEMRYRAIVEDQTELICRLRRDGTITFVNQAFCKYYHREHDSLIGDNFFDTVHPQDRPRMVEHFRRLHPTLPLGTIEYRTQLPDGTEHWLRWTIRWLSDRTSENNNPSDQHLKLSQHLIEEDEIQVVGLDITGRKISEQAIQRNEVEHRKLAERSKTLLRELDHRVKNNLAGLYSLLSIYESSSTDVSSFASSLRGKVMAMKTVHELTATNVQSAIDLSRLIQLLSHQFPALTQQTQPVTLNGPAVNIASQQVSPMAMAIQELFTNSKKHGALASTAGAVQISWRWLDHNIIDKIDPAQHPNDSDNNTPNDSVHHASNINASNINASNISDSNDNTLTDSPVPTQRSPMLELIWHEHGLENVVQPTQYGVGLDLIIGFAQFELGGSANFEFKPTGLRCTLCMALAQIECQ